MFEWIGRAVAQYRAEMEAEEAAYKKRAAFQTELNKQKAEAMSSMAILAAGPLRTVSKMYGAGQTNSYGQDDVVQFEVRRVANGHIVTAYQHGSNGALTKTFTRVVPSGGDLLEQIAAVMADLALGG